MSNFVLIVVWLLTGGLLAFNLFFRSPEESAKAANIGASEISDLIARLRPLAKEPDGMWYSNGLTVQITGGDVRIILKTPGGNEYVGHARTLDEAVTRLTAPSTDIANALKGWKP